MAQRRSRNRRLSARKSNVSGFLNEDTNIYDNDDPLWYDRTAVRPSTSLYMSKNTKAVLDPDSTIHTSQLPENWFENLTQSESSKLLEEAVKKKKSQQYEDSNHRSSVTESESEHEFQKKRANLRYIRKQSNKSNKSNAFMKALEKTTDSHTKNLTYNQIMEGNESELTRDDSRTIRKLRPKFTRHIKNNTNNFDKALESDSASERIETNMESFRSIPMSEINEEFASPEKQKRITRSMMEKTVNVSHEKKSVEKLQDQSVNKSKDKTNSQLSLRGLKNKNFVTPPINSATPVKSTKKSSAKKKKHSEDQLTDSSSSSPEVKKYKRHLFSQENKSAIDKSKENKSAFDAALDSMNDSHKSKTVMTEAVNTSKANGQSKMRDNDDDSDSSSIPQNIRRTTSRFLFDEINSNQTEGVNSSKNKSRTLGRNLSKNASQSLKNRSLANESTNSNKQNSTNKKKSKIHENDSVKNLSQFSKDKLMANEIHESDKQKDAFKNQTLSESSNIDEDMYKVSLTRSKTVEAKSNKSKSAEIQVSNIETDSEDMVNETLSKNKQSEVSSVETSEDGDMINMSYGQTKEKNVDTSKKFNESSVKVNKSRVSKSISTGDKYEEDLSNAELSKRKSRSRLFPKKNISKDENAFDQIFVNKSLSVKEKSKEKEIEETPRLSQRSPKIIDKFQNDQSANVSKNKSSSLENTKNNSRADESEDETSTIPQHIRRTRSRLFQKSKANDDDNVFENALDAPENQIELSQTSRTLNTLNKSIIRDAVANKSVSETVKKKPKIIYDKIIQSTNSGYFLPDNSKKNQESRGSNLHKSEAITSSNKEKSVRNSQNIASTHRFVETSSDGTPNSALPKETSTPFAPPILSKKLTKRVSTMLRSTKFAQNSTYDDLLHTPNPAQSTLNPHGKPVDRITLFSFRTSADPEVGTPPATTVEATKTQPNTVTENDDDVDVVNTDDIDVVDENEDIDVVNESEVSDSPLIKNLTDHMSDKGNFSLHKVVPVVSKSLKKHESFKKTYINNKNMLPIDWEKAKQHTDAIKLMVEAQMRLTEEARKKRELEKQRINAKIKRWQAQKEAELKRKNKKPIHKAFLVDGKVYKQPQLPRPKPWATDKLYRYLKKKMEPKFGMRTRLKSEEFVLLLSEFATRIAKRKKFENYRKELDEIMMVMAKLGIIKTRFDFYRFTADFLPHSFREKVNPMMMPGNERNIPYEPELLYKPLLNDSRNSQDTSDTDE